jgi:hypothetical protein
MAIRTLYRFLVIVVCGLFVINTATAEDELDLQSIDDTQKNQASLDASSPNKPDTEKKYTAEEIEKLTCSKRARRVYKIKDHQKRREFIKQCRAEREAEEKVIRDKKEQERLKKEAEKNKLLNDFLK